MSGISLSQFLIQPPPPSDSSDRRCTTQLPQATAMKAAPHQSPPSPPTSRSLSLRSDGSDFEFDSSEFASNEPPISPTLYSFSSPWKGSASGDLVSASHSSPRHLHNVALPPHKPADAYGGANDFASNKTHHDYYDDLNLDGQLIQSADGCFGRRSLDSVNTALNNKFASSSSLSLDTIDAHQLSLRASSIPIIPHKSAESLLRGSPASVSESSPQSSPTFWLANDVHHRGKRRRWSFSLDFWHSFSSNELDNSHQDGRSTAVKIVKANSHGAAVFTEAHDNRHESYQKSPSRSSARSARTMSQTKLAIKREKVLIHSTGQTTGSKHSASSPLSPAAAASYRLQSVRYEHSSPMTTLPVKKPMSPHAQHYEHQRALAQQLNRRTSLPYRHNLLGSCFFPSTRPVASY